MLDFGAILKDSLGIVRKNYTLALPTFVGVFVLSFISLAVIKSTEETSRLVVMGFIGMIFSLFVHGLTLVMAKEAIETGTTSLGTGISAAVRLFWSFLSAALMMAAIVSAGSMMFLLPGIIAGFFLMFAFPSIAVENAGAIDAFKRSYKVTRANLKDSAILFAVILVYGTVVLTSNILLSTIPVIGQLFGVALSGAFGGFMAVVVTRAFKALAMSPPVS